MGGTRTKAAEVVFEADCRCSEKTAVLWGMCGRESRRIYASRSEFPRFLDYPGREKLRDKGRLGVRVKEFRDENDDLVWDRFLSLDYNIGPEKP